MELIDWFILVNVIAALGNITCVYVDGNQKSYGKPDKLLVAILLSIPFLSVIFFPCFWIWDGKAFKPKWSKLSSVVYLLPILSLLGLYFI